MAPGLNDTFFFLISKIDAAKEYERELRLRRRRLRLEEKATRQSASEETNHNNEE